MAIDKNIPESHQLCTVNAGAPFQFVEAYKALRTTVEFLASASDCKILLVTSSVSGEGKSNVTANLAFTMSATGKKVALVDGDLRRGTLASYMNLPENHAGITDMIKGNVSLQEVVMTVNQTLLFVPAGPASSNPVEMLSDEKMQRLLEELKDRVDYVIVNTPPVSLVTDAAILSRYADGVLLVVRSGVTAIQAAQLSKKKLEAVNAKILGVILNDYDARKSGHRDGYYYSHSQDYGRDNA